MAKLFNKIRKRLVSEKPSTTRTTNYLKYAIGEIVLVVIGILIALQINTWNENRKKNIEETKFLISLNNEIIYNQKGLKDVIKDHKFVLEKVNELAKLMNPNPKEIKLEKLDTLMFAVVFLPKFNPITTMLSSDKFELIKDEEIKNKIATWKYSFNSYKDNLKFTYDHYANYMYSFISENYPIKNLKDGLIKSDQSFFDINVRSILSNSTFENHVKLRSFQEKFIYDSAIELYDIQINIIESIELKLSKEVNN